MHLKSDLPFEQQKLGVGWSGFLDVQIQIKASLGRIPLLYNPLKMTSAEVGFKLPRSINLEHVELMIIFWAKGL